MVAPTVTFRVLTLCWKLFTLSSSYPKQLMMKSKQVGTKPIHRLTTSINGKNSDFVMAHPNAADERPQEASSCVLALRFLNLMEFSLPVRIRYYCIAFPFRLKEKYYTAVRCAFEKMTGNCARTSLCNDASWNWKDNFRYLFFMVEALWGRVIEVYLPVFRVQLPNWSSVRINSIKTKIRCRSLKTNTNASFSSDPYNSVNDVWMVGILFNLS